LPAETKLMSEKKAPQATFSNEVQPESPCVNLCSLDDAYGYCVGCYRTMDEIAGWGSMSAAERWAVLRRVAERAGQRALEVK
jgi:predicted Fe-S protein YdhL (DUF1289 family)